MKELKAQRLKRRNIGELWAQRLKRENMKEFEAQDLKQGIGGSALQQNMKELWAQI